MLACVVLVAAASTAAAIETDPALFNNQTVYSITDSGLGSFLYFSFDLPAGATDLRVETWFGTGNVDLYLRFATKPDFSSYDCVSTLPGNEDACSIAEPAAGRWWAGLRVAADYEGVRLLGTFTTPSGWTAFPPTIDGGAGAKEWDGAGAFTMQHGVVYFLNDATDLYMLLDVADDTVEEEVWHAGAGDYWVVAWDANENGSGDEGVDLEHGTCQDLSVLTKYLLNDSSGCGFSGSMTSSGDGAKGFGSTTLSATPHTFWEIRLPLSEIGAKPGETTRFQPHFGSTSPAIYEAVPYEDCTWDEFNALRLAGLPRMLWSAEDTYAMVWTVTEHGTFADMQGFGLEGGWWATSYQGNPDGSAYLLWAKPDTGLAQVWTITAAGTFGGMQGFGIGPGWSALSYQRNPDGSAQLLWADTVKGNAQLWTLGPGGTWGGMQGFSLGPGWIAMSHQQHEDGSAELLWANGANGVAQLWTLTPGGGWGGMVGFGLAPGWYATVYQRALDASSRLVWSYSGGQTQVWTLTPGGGWGGMHGYGVGVGWIVPGYWTPN